MNPKALLKTVFARIALCLVGLWSVIASTAPIRATAILDTPPGFNGGAGAGLLTGGTVGGHNWPWTEVSPGWRQGLGVPAEVRVDASAPKLGQGYFRVESAPTRPE